MCRFFFIMASLLYIINSNHVAAAGDYYNAVTSRAGRMRAAGVAAAEQPPVHYYCDTIAYSI